MADISSLHHKLLDEYQTFLQRLFTERLDQIKFDCRDPIQLRVCANRKPVGTIFATDNVEDLEVNSPLYYNALMHHRDGKAVYFTKCLEDMCEHSMVTPCRVIARYHIANIMVMEYLRARYEYGREWRDFDVKYSACNFLMHDFDFVNRCEHSSDEDGNDTDLLSE